MSAKIDSLGTPLRSAQHEYRWIVRLTDLQGRSTLMYPSCTLRVATENARGWRDFEGHHYSRIQVVDGYDEFESRDI